MEEGEEKDSEINDSEVSKTEMLMAEIFLLKNIDYHNQLFSDLTDLEKKLDKEINQSQDQKEL